MALTSSAATSYLKTCSIYLLGRLPSPSSSSSSSFSSSTSNGDELKIGLFNPSPPNQALPRHLLLSSTSPTTLAFSRPRNRSPSSAANKKKRNWSIKKASVETGEDEDALEALFSMLEEDLKNDDLSINEEEDHDDDISEEDMDKLQRELEEALGVDIGDELVDDDFTSLEMANHEKEEEEEEEEEKEKERPAKLKTWQLRRLAFALKTGRRKTSIKSLAEELCLDRAVVLEYLRDPPPGLVMMSAALPDEPAPRLLIPQRKPLELVVPVKKKSVDDAAVGNSGVEVKAPIHVMRHQWSAQKRLKKVHLQTLERVYRRTRRPTNTMISSIVQVTNLPRKRVVKWFEDRRSEDGVPDQRLPYRRSVSDSTSPC